MYSGRSFGTGTIGGIAASIKVQGILATQREQGEEDAVRQPRSQTKTEPYPLLHQPLLAATIPFKGALR